MPRFLFVVSILVSQLAFGSDFGTTGLLKIPSARMQADGVLSGTVLRDELADIFNISYQATPWLETTVRYSIFNPRQLSRSEDSNRDRSYAVKIGVLEETRKLPQLAFGIRDVFGTGIWEGEYLVGSKRFASLDLSLGLGWGRFAELGRFQNPLRLVSDGFEFRPSRGITGGEFGGESRTKSFFRGPSAIFGGIRYQTAINNLSAVIEFNSDQHTREYNLGTAKKQNPWGIGLEWRQSDEFVITSALTRGNAFSIRFVGRLNTKNLPKKKNSAMFHSSLEGRTLSGAPKEINLDSRYDRLLFDIERSGLLMHGANFSANDETLSIVLENSSYEIHSDAVSQAASLVRAHGLSNDRRLSLHFMDNGYSAPTFEFIPRPQETGMGRFQNSSDKYEYRRFDLEISEPQKLKQFTNVTDYGLPRVLLGADASLKTQLMDPNDPLRKQLYLRLSARTRLSQNTDIWVLYGQNLYNDFEADRKSNSTIRKVRSDINEYLTQGSSGFDQVFIEYRNSLSGAIHFRAYAGILEMMYGGVGFEFLIDPFESRLALGLTLNRLRQREFDRGFDFREYRTTTGFVSLFYASSIYNLDFATHIGKYLARDRGATFEVRRSFANGYSVGGFFTRTNLAKADFGEGGFDKGLFFRIPLNGILPWNTKNSVSTIMRPLDRDGGRRLEDFSGSLWYSRQRYRFDYLYSTKDRAAL